MNMEVNDFRIALFDGEEDEEFMSCDEGDEEDLPKFSATCEDIFGTAGAGNVCFIPCLDAVQGEDKSHDKDSVVKFDNNAVTLLDTGDGRNSLRTNLPLEEIREIGTGFNCMTSLDTQASVDWSRVRSLSQAYDRVSKRTDGGKLWSLDEEEEDTEEESDDDYEFFDSRSSISRIQSLDEGHSSMFEALQRHSKKRSPDKEFGDQFLQFQTSEEKVKDSDIAEVDSVKKSAITEVDAMNNLDSTNNGRVKSDITEVDQVMHFVKTSDTITSFTPGDKKDHYISSVTTSELEHTAFQNDLTANAEIPAGVSVVDVQPAASLSSQTLDLRVIPEVQGSGSSTSFKPTLAEPEVGGQPTSLLSANIEPEVRDQPTSLLSANIEPEVREQPSSLLSANIEPEVREQPSSLLSANIEPEAIGQPTSLLSANKEPKVRNQPTSLLSANIEPEVRDQPTSLLSANIEPEVRDQPTSLLSANIEPEVGSQPTSLLSANIEPEIRGQTTSLLSANKEPKVRGQPTSLLSANKEPKVRGQPTSLLSANIEPEVRGQPTSLLSANKEPKVRGQPTSLLSANKEPKVRGQPTSLLSANKEPKVRGQPTSLLSANKEPKVRGQPTSLLSANKEPKVRCQPTSLLSTNKEPKVRGQPTSLLSANKEPKVRGQPTSFLSAKKEPKVRGQPTSLLSANTEPKVRGQPTSLLSANIEPEVRGQPTSLLSANIEPEVRGQPTSLLSANKEPKVRGQPTSLLSANIEPEVRGQPTSLLSANIEPEVRGQPTSLLSANKEPKVRGQPTSLLSANIEPEVRGQPTSLLSANIEQEIRGQTTSMLSANKEPEVIGQQTSLLSANIEPEVRGQSTSLLSANIEPEVRGQPTSLLSANIEPEVRGQPTSLLSANIEPEVRGQPTSLLSANIEQEIRGQTTSLLSANKEPEVIGQQTSLLSANIELEVRGQPTSLLSANIEPEVRGQPTSLLSANIEPEVRGQPTSLLSANIEPEVRGQPTSLLSANIEQEIRGQTTSMSSANIEPEVRSQPTSLLSANIEPEVRGQPTSLLSANIEPEVRGQTTSLLSANKEPEVIGQQTSLLSANIEPEVRGQPTSLLSANIEPEVRGQPTSLLSANIEPEVRGQPTSLLSANIEPEVRGQPTSLLSANIEPEVRGQPTSLLSANIEQEIRGQTTSMLSANIEPEVRSQPTSLLSANIEPEVRGQPTSLLSANIAPEVRGQTTSLLSANKEPEVIGQQTSLLSANIEPEVRGQPTSLLSANIEPEVRGQPTSLLSANIEQEIRGQTTSMLSANIEPEVRSQPTSLLSANIEPEVRGQPTSLLSANIAPEVRGQTTSLLSANKEPEVIGQQTSLLSANIEPEVRGQPTSLLSANIESEVRGQPTSLLSANIEQEIRGQTTSMLSANIEPEVRSQPTSLLSANIEQEIRGQTTSMLSANIEPEVRNQPTSLLSANIEPEVIGQQTSLLSANIEPEVRGQPTSLLSANIESEVIGQQTSLLSANIEPEVRGQPTSLLSANIESEVRGQQTSMLSGHMDLVAASGLSNCSECLHAETSVPAALSTGQVIDVLIKSSAQLKHDMENTKLLSDCSPAALLPVCSESSEVTKKRQTYVISSDATKGHTDHLQASSVQSNLVAAPDKELECLKTSGMLKTASSKSLSVAKTVRPDAAFEMSEVDLENSGTVQTPSSTDVLISGTCLATKEGNCSQAVANQELSDLPIINSEDPTSLNSSCSVLNQLDETLQESPHVVGPPELDSISCSHIIQTCSSGPLEESASALQTANSPASVNDIINKVCTETTRNDIQHQQSPDKRPQVELTGGTATRQNLTASAGVHCNTVPVISKYLPGTTLRQLSTSTQKISPPGLPHNQQPRVMSQSPHTNLTSLALSVGGNVDDQLWNTNTSGLPSKIYSDHQNTDSEEDNVSEDSLGEVCGANTSSVDPVFGDAASPAGSDTNLSDSLDEDNDENVLNACTNVLTRLEEKPKDIDKHKAKLRASLSWLLSKVYGSSIPKELQDPFYETAEGQLILRPVIVNLLSSSELYCQACSNLFPDIHTQWQGHWSIIQVLSRKGIYISEIQESAVTETVLVQTAPLRLKAHLALIDALMQAYIYEVASVEKVVKAVRRITTFPASSELPATPEEALVFWVNKVCTVLGTEGKAEEEVERAAGQKVRAVKASPYNETVQVPLLDDLMRDIGDGCSVAAVIAYYRPQLLSIKDLCLKEDIGIADALYNLQQIGNFCQIYLSCRCLHLSYEDLLYTHNEMKMNIIAFLADLFHSFEGPDSCQGQDGGLGSLQSSPDKVDALPAAGKKSSQAVHGTIPISQVTKRSFHRPSLEETSSNLGMGRSAVTSPIFHQPLLSKRISGRHCIPQEEAGISLSASTKRTSSRRALSLSTAQDRDLVHKSVLAWQDDQRLQHRSDMDGDVSNPYNRLSANVSLDSAFNRNSNANSNLSLDFSNLESHRQDYMEVESITSDTPHFNHPHQHTDRLSNRTPTSAVTEQRLEPLMPALLKPSKEKLMNLSKAQESGDRSPKKKKLMPSSDQTPVASSVQRSTAFSPVPPGGRSQSPYHRSPPQGSRGKAFEAFMVGPGCEGNAALETKPKQGISGNTSQPVLQRVTDMSPAGSYTVQDRASSIQAARAAGIPVVSDSEDTPLTAIRSREGSIASSGEYSDHESRKIHQEYKVRESGFSTTADAKMAEANISNNGSSKPIMLISDHLSSVPTKLDGDDSSILNKLSSKTTTNFAELKRLKDNLGYNLDRMDRSALIYMQSGSHGGPYDKMSGIDLKSSFVNKQGQGQPHSNGDSNKTGGTEQDPHMSGSADMTDNAVLEASETNPGSLELQQLRLKLEQKRKDIERKKHRQEAQHNKMRQQLGKAAFMRVVSKHGDGAVEGESSDQADTARSDQSASSSQIQLQARLGQLAQKVPGSGTPRHQLPAHLTTLQATLGQNPAIPADVSAQRFTDWRTQSQWSRGGGGGSVFASPSTDNHFKSKDQTQLPQAHTGALGGGGAGLAYSPAIPETSRNKAFSRLDMQQTIDNVRNKWFKSDSDLISSGRAGSGDEEVDGDSFRLHDEDLLAGARPRSMQDRIHTPPRSHSQSPLQAISQSVPTLFAETLMPASTQDTGSPPLSDMEYQVYDSSLHKLNSSLTELQGEIMRLSLQHEQFKAAQSPVGGFSPRLSDGSVTGLSPAQSRPIHGIPQQVPFMQGSPAVRSNGPSSSNQQQPPPLAQENDIATPPVNRDAVRPGVSDISPQTRSAYESEPTSAQPRQEAIDTEDATSTNNDGFFVSFGGTTTPKRLKPKLSENRARGVSPAPNAAAAQTPLTRLGSDEGISTAQTPLTGLGSDEGISNEVAANLANQTIVATLNIQKDDDLSDELSSPRIGFMIKDVSPVAKEAVGDDDMQKKKIKLIEMQRKRKEEYEKKRLEKEAETARKLEEKQLKEEEQERKKAEEKARRELIFQQYLQKKQEDDDSPAKPTPKKRDASASKQRPKSMFVKKAMTPEPGALAPDSGSSSQEDLTSRGTLSGRSTPSVMSALRSTFHFRLPQPSKIRKAVSCNTLQGASNGATGPSTYRRPPSPDLNRLKQQRQRGSSQESGSETGSGSNPGSDYAGPKLFVKPSAKSNRHIIVNAISHCCLAGSVNTDMKNKVLEELAKCDANHFLILFRDAGCQYRGLFIFYPETEEAFKVLGVGPKHIINTMCEKFYKYNSGAKSFSEITSTKHLSVSVDAVVLHTSVWKSGKAVIKR